MTHKHFRALAAVLASTRPDVNPSEQPLVWRTWRDTVHAVARVCRANNPNFDYERFVGACGADT